MALDPNSAYGYSAIGRAEAQLGRCEQSIAHIKQAFALSPRDPNSGIWYVYLAFAEFCRGRLDGRSSNLSALSDSGYPSYTTYAFLAGAEAAKGNDAEAKLALTEARRLFPQLTIKWIADRDGATTIDRYRWLAQGWAAGRMSARALSSCQLLAATPSPPSDRASRTLQ